jgi:hypothetical protein
MYASKKLVEIRSLHFEDEQEVHMVAQAIATVVQDDVARRAFASRGNYSDKDIKKLSYVLDTMDMNFA